MSVPIYRIDTSSGTIAFKVLENGTTWRDANVAELVRIHEGKGTNMTALLAPPPAATTGAANQPASAGQAAAPANTWKCSKGHDVKDTDKRCPDCGEGRLWTCRDCGYDDNPADRKTCADCGEPRVKPEAPAAAKHAPQKHGSSHGKEDQPHWTDKLPKWMVK